MTAEMRPLSFSQLLSWALAERGAAGSVFGVPESLFFVPRIDRRLETSRPLGTAIATPFGPAAGPHSQLAQNIASAWLCGGRFIELKTVQVLDRLEIPRPCIAAADEGYNVEWSQELTLDQSAREYAHAWSLVHIMPRALGWPEGIDRVLFNQSVGYTLDGVRSPSLQKFLDRMTDARDLLAPVRRTLHAEFPDLADVEIPNRISDSVTLSTMHGCPPEEIERIARHLLEDRGLHVIVKLNPTLLGKERVREILHERLGHRDLDVPDDVFAHDLRFDACLDLIASLRSVAARSGRLFAVKLSNTLAVRNTHRALPGDMVYMSGRALYPLTVSLFAELRRAVGPDLAVSYSAGADSENAPALVAAGACPVTVATDLLKPGGYGRLRQYIDCLEERMDAEHASTVDELASRDPAAIQRLARDAVTVARYRRDAVAPDLPKIADPLTAFDCIAAPCVAACPACQDVPVYAAHLAEGNTHAALATILGRNLMPETTGHICTARCETRCTRNSVDRHVRIRDLKRFAAERGSATLAVAPATGHRVAVIGGGPSGLAAAGHLAASGVEVTVFEIASRAGGMPSIAPAFRIPPAAVERDVARIVALGAHIRTGAAAPSPSDLLTQGYSAVYLACGFAGDAPLRIPGIATAGVFGALDILRCVAEGHSPALGPRVLVIGGGNTAMDAARTACRLAPSVTIVYRRTRAELPAEPEEVADFLAEGGTLLELVTPIEAISDAGRLVALDCVRNHLGAPDPDGRLSSVPMPETRFRIPADSLIVAIGQTPPPMGTSFDATRRPGGEVLVDAASGLSSLPGVYAGGDATRGPSTIIEATADGRRAAETICLALGVPFHMPQAPHVRHVEERIARARTARARRIPSQEPDRLPVERRTAFALVTAPLSEAAARAEAARCLQCQLVCDRCVDVCPNRANHSYAVEPFAQPVPVFDLARGTQVGTETARISQTRQIVHVVDLCNECGNCATFCTHDGRPFADKPRLFLSRDAFEADGGPGLLSESGTLCGKDAHGMTWSLVPDGRGFRYTDAHLNVQLSPSLEVRAARLVAGGRGTRSAACAVEAAAIFRGLQASAVWMLVDRARGEDA